MPKNVLIIGAGMGGLAAAARLAQRGCRVRVLEARQGAGGLASRLEFEGFWFDAGPYILLDRPGLEWVFSSLGYDLEERLSLRRIGDVYEVRTKNELPVRLKSSLEATAEGMEKSWPGSGERYLEFIESTGRAYRRLQALQRVSQPGFIHVIKSGVWRDMPFLLRSLGSVLSRARLPAPVTEAIAIWTHIAGQKLAAAPSPLAFVPSLIHHFGAYYPLGGIAAVPQALLSIAAAAGVEFHYGMKVRAIRCEGGRAIGVETGQGEFIEADAVVSNVNGVSTYLELVPEIPRRARRQLSTLPLQSPGVCAYLAIKGKTPPPYLRFYLPGGDEPCRLMVAASEVSPEAERGGWWPARLIAPMDYLEAEGGGPEAQREYLERIVGEGWWKEGISEYRVLAARIPAEWGEEHHLYKNSMNPVMTTRFMLAGRLAHRSPLVRGLYLAGSSTHPGQWVSFCAISGILAADRAQEDFR